MGTATTMLVVVGTAIVVVMTIMLGHYNSLAHCGPKAVLDGAVIALLIGRHGRWRCLGLLGIVYGLVLLLQVAVVYLIIVTAVAGGVAAATGRGLSILNRSAALFAAAVVYELLAGFGAPIKIVLGTPDAREPILWGMWLVEWPIRITGATIGVWSAKRWMKRAAGRPATTIGQSVTHRTPLAHRPTTSTVRVQGVLPTASRLAAAIVACVVPMMLQNWYALGLIAMAYLGYAIWAGIRRYLLHVFAAMFWGWLLYAAASYLWHQDHERVVDLLRTLVLRFLPLTLASLVVVSTLRPVDVLRVLRRLRISRVILIPFAAAVRYLPQARRDVATTLEMLRQDGVWEGPMTLLRRPRTILAAVLGPPLRRWGDQLAER